MSLLNTISKDTEKIIWNYFHKFNNIEKHILEILNHNYYDYYDLLVEEDKKYINLLDVLETYSNINCDKDIRLMFKNDDFNFHINKNNVKNIIKYNKNKFNCLIKQIIKMNNSNTIYIKIN